MNKIYEVYKNFVVGIIGISLYLLLVGTTTVNIYDFCCFNFTLKGWYE